MPHPSLTLVMPTISWEEPFVSCARAALAGLGPLDEALVVFDGTPPPAPEWLRRSGAGLLNTAERSGPAAARNLAARTACGEILVFVDADVELHSDAIERIRVRFAAEPELAALFGSYDDRPAADGVVSRFRNLLHHHTHASHPGPAITFWAGCGAVRRQAFLALGGFDAAAYDRPCIEDIEFGLRLSDAGGRIELDPAIQGTHHKRWTLASMVATDIRQRAIPWSQLLLQRRQLPAILNLAIQARISAVLALLLPLCLFGVLNPILWPWALTLFSGCLGCLLLLNQDFYCLLRRRCGLVEASIGVGLHGLVLAYSTLTFALVALLETLQHPVNLSVWGQSNAGLQRSFLRCALILLSLLALATISTGLIYGWDVPPFDLGERWDEWRLFSQGIYPSGLLARPEQQALPYFRTTVYLPWALPMFAPLFFWGGRLQGVVFIHVLSLLSLVLIATIGWFSLRRFGSYSGWLGALAPLAIAGNFSALNKGQFAIVSMGLISLQWLLLLRRCHPLSPGFCWALAMVKPQIAWTFALPFLARGRLAGLLLGVGLLLGLSVLALAYTHSDPCAYLISWLQLLPSFMGDANLNGASGLVALLRRMPSPFFVGLGGVSSVGIGIVVSLIWKKLFPARPQGEGYGGADPMLLAGLCAIVGQLAFYHRYYDNIMLYPALLFAVQRVFLKQRLLEALLATLMAASVWTPQRLLDLLPGSAVVQTVIWSLLGVYILRALLIDAAVDPAAPSVTG
ncbi:MAG: glycosyltransferase [Cyanobacteria bacterium]|nr:glycosyltransferase [Cyanobacteriota bacterium]